MNSGLCETTQGLKWKYFSEEDNSMAFAVLCFKNVHTPPPRGGAICAYKSIEKLYTWTTKSLSIKETKSQSLYVQIKLYCAYSVRTNLNKLNNFNYTDATKEYL